MAAPYGDGETVQERLTNNIATIGENQVIRRVKSLSVSNGRVVSYVHNAAAPGMGGIGVLVALESEADAATLDGLGKQLAMHIAAAFPLSLDETGLMPKRLSVNAASHVKRHRKRKPAEYRREWLKARVKKFAKENAL